MSRRAILYAAGGLLVVCAFASFVLIGKQGACAANGALFDLRSWTCVKPPPAILQREDLKRV